MITERQARLFHGRKCQTIKESQDSETRKGRIMELFVRENKKGAPELVTPEADFRIYGFMRTSLGLEKTALLVYALIYSSFCRGALFTASREYISQWVGSSKSAVDSAISDLVERGYISKTQRRCRGDCIVEYTINTPPR